MKTFIVPVLLLVLFAGCKTQLNNKEDCIVAKMEKDEAVKVAYNYAKNELGVNSEISNRLVITDFCDMKDGQRILVFSFFDTKYYPNPNEYEGILGGFPHFFVVEVSLSSMTVVGSYASAE